MSGALFTLSTGIRPKGEALAFSLFGGLAVLGFAGSFLIRRAGLEGSAWKEDEVEEDENEDEERRSAR